MGPSGIIICYSSAFEAKSIQQDGADVSAGLGIAGGLLTIVGAAVPASAALGGVAGFLTGLLALTQETAEYVTPQFSQCGCKREDRTLT